MEASILSAMPRVNIDMDFEIKNKFTSRLDCITSKRKLLPMKDLVPKVVSSESCLELVGSKRILLVDDDSFNL